MYTICLVDTASLVPDNLSIAAPRIGMSRSSAACILSVTGNKSAGQVSSQPAKQLWHPVSAMALMKVWQTEGISKVVVVLTFDACPQPDVWLGFGRPPVPFVCGGVEDVMVQCDVSGGGIG